MKKGFQPGFGSAAFWAAGAAIIGHALWLSDGSYDAAALAWVGVGMAMAWGGTLVAADGGTLTPALSRRTEGGGFAVWVCVAGYLWQLYEFWNDSPLPELAAPLGYYAVVVPLFAVGGLGAMLLPRFSRTVFIPLLLMTQFSYGAWLLHAAKKPPIDVYVVTRDACAAMSRGENPYAIDFPDIFSHTANWESRFYPPEFVSEGRIHFGYQYMPLSFYVAWAGHVILGDFRLGSLLAVTAAGALMAYCRGGALAAGAACLWLLSPRNYYVIDRGWAEPAVVLCLALVVFAACRRPGWAPWAAGLLIVSKQHMILAAPAMLLLLPRPWEWKTAIRFFLKAAMTGAAVTLPLVLWNFAAFWKSAVRVQLENPFRGDSLNFAAQWVHMGHPPPPAWIAFTLAALAAAVCVWRCPRTAAGFAAAVAVIYLSFFALSKQTFCNYYFLAIGALCCAAAAESRAWQTPRA